jgi:hypothetical protein
MMSAAVSSTAVKASVMPTATVSVMMTVVGGTVLRSVMVVMMAVSM